MFEIIHSAKGVSYKVRCLHHSEVRQDGAEGLLLEVLVPHYEVAYFLER